MPKHSSVQVLRRWQDMDRLLARGRLHLDRFAQKWNVTRKTVLRDLRDFEELGFPSEYKPFDWKKYGLKERDYASLWEKIDPTHEDFDGPYYGYTEGQTPLFTASLPEQPPKPKRSPS